MINDNVGPRLVRACYLRVWTSRGVFGEIILRWGGERLEIGIQWEGPRLSFVERTIFSRSWAYARQQPFYIALLRATDNLWLRYPWPYRTISLRGRAATTRCFTLACSTPWCISLFDRKMENEQHHYELRSGSRSRSHTPMVPNRPLPDLEVTEHHYDLRRRSRERSHTPGEVTSSRRSGTRSLWVVGLNL